MMKSFVVVIVAVLALGLTLGVGGHLANACPDTNWANLEPAENMDVSQDGSFSFTLEAEWSMKTNPSWVIVEPALSGQFNVTNVAYTPQYLQYQNCVDSYTFTCEGNLQRTDLDGNVNSQLNVGLSPNYAFDVEATFVPKP